MSLVITLFYLVVFCPKFSKYTVESFSFEFIFTFSSSFHHFSPFCSFLEMAFNKMNEWYSLGWMLIPLLFSLFWPRRKPSSPHGHLLPSLCCCSAFAAAQWVILGNWSDWGIILPKLCCLFPHSGLPYGCTNGYVSSRERMMQGWKWEARLRSGSGMLC